MIPTDLLKNFQGRALGTCIYGNGGLKKTLAIRTLPAPILELDFEGGSGSLGPWTRRIRRWDEKGWRKYSQAEREQLMSMVSPENLKHALLKPAPLVDIISFATMTVNADATKSPAYDEAVQVIGNLNGNEYNSLAVDPLVEFSQLTQSQSKVSMRVDVLAPMHVKLWQGAQERAAIMLRQLREYRDKGLFVYLTSSEFVDKDYGTDPREGSAQQKEEPYAIKGTLNVPGQLVTKLNHMVDLQFHVRMMNGEPVWVTQEEPARSGSFNWEAKDRTGRIQEKYVKPNMRTVIEQVYGVEAKNAIYSLRKEQA